MATMIILLTTLLLSGLATGFVQSKYVFRVNSSPVPKTGIVLPTPRAIYYSGEFTGYGVIAQPVLEPNQ